MIAVRRGGIDVRSELVADVDAPARELADVRMRRAALLRVAHRELRGPALPSSPVSPTWPPLSA